MNHLPLSHITMIQYFFGTHSQVDIEFIKRWVAEELEREQQLSEQLAQRYDHEGSEARDPLDSDWGD